MKKRVAAAILFSATVAHADAPDSYGIGSRNAALGSEGTVRVLLNENLDTIRFETLWNLDLRVAKTAKFGSRASMQLIADLFNVLNSNTEITRERNAAATTFRVLGSNLSPRILRFGARLSF